MSVSAGQWFPCLSVFYLGLSTFHLLTLILLEVVLKDVILQNYLVMCFKHFLLASLTGRKAEGAFILHANLWWKVEERFHYTI